MPDKTFGSVLALLNNVSMMPPDKTFGSLLAVLNLHQHIDARQNLRERFGCFESTSVMTVSDTSIRMFHLVIAIQKAQREHFGRFDNLCASRASATSIRMFHPAIGIIKSPDCNAIAGWPKSTAYALQAF
ncbi:MAG TPA: hypothetical protein VK133_01090 [Amoebophilaceae bacterium]|nr:hypothetical protein [Amoebophilaceae bacterium]